MLHKKNNLLAISIFLIFNCSTAYKFLSTPNVACTQKHLGTRLFRTQYRNNNIGYTMQMDNNEEIGELEYSYDDSKAESQFGTKEYWDNMYVGMGDFDSEEYSWYFGFDTIKPIFLGNMPIPSKEQNDENRGDDMRMLVPGVGNDGSLLDLYNFGYKNIVAFDYSSHAIDRQRDLISYDQNALRDIQLLVRDARELDAVWTESFDVIFEKGGLDAIYLSGPGNVDIAVKELKRVIKPGGYFMSVSGVLPEDLRRKIFSTDDWKWIRDGSNDLKAGCFVWQKNM